MECMIDQVSRNQRFYAHRRGGGGGLNNWKFGIQLLQLKNHTIPRARSVAVETCRIHDETQKRIDTMETNFGEFQFCGMFDDTDLSILRVYTMKKRASKKFQIQISLFQLHVKLRQTLIAAPLKYLYCANL